jgi:hypothetical protein
MNLPILGTAGRTVTEAAEGGDSPTRGSGAFNAVTPRTTVTAVMTRRATVVTAETTTVGASEAVRMKFSNEFQFVADCY